MIVDKRTFISAISIIFVALVGVFINSTAVCRICVLMLLVACILKGLREKYMLNPYFMFALVPFSLLIYANISRYHLDLNTNTWLLAIINITAFIVAMDFTPGFNKFEKCKGIGDGSQFVSDTLLLLALGFVPTIYSILFGGTMPLASIFTLFSSGALICALKSHRKGLIAFVIAVFLASWIGYVSKTSVFTFAIATLIGYEKYYVESKKQKKVLIVLSLLGILLMIAAFSFANQGRGSMSGMSAVQYYSTYGGAMWNGNANLFMPYMYITTPWANLQYVMETQASRTYGLWLIKPFLGYFQLDKFFESFYKLEAYSTFNTFTYLAYGYKDFGFWGSCFSSFFLGYFVKRIYSRFIITRSPLDVTCYVLVAKAVLEMFFSNHFFTQSYPFTIVIIMGIYKVIFSKIVIINWNQTWKK